MNECSKVVVIDANKLIASAMPDCENIEYKAQAKGIRVVYVDARYTSQKCSRCGYISRSNRIDQSHFVCKHCGFSLNADLNASRNIVKNYLASLQKREVGTGAGISAPVGRRQSSRCSGATC